MITHSVPEIYVREFHTVLDRLENIKVEISEFRIPDSEVKPKVRTIIGRERRYSENKYVERAFLLTKMDAILGYLKNITSEKPRKIGFHPPESQ